MSDELKTLKVSEESWKKIQRIKLDYNLSSVEEVINMLIKRARVKNA